MHPAIRSQAARPKVSSLHAPAYRLAFGSAILVAGLVHTLGRLLGS